jgi:hypothetical protein
MLDDFPDLDADGEEGIRVVEYVVGVAIDETGLADAGFAEEEEFDGKGDLLAGKGGNRHLI